MRYLLDVNCLLAAIYKKHSGYAAMEAWLPGKSLASCALSELGYLRISTNPKALNVKMAPSRKLLGDFLKENAVQFIPADLPALSSVAFFSKAVMDKLPCGPGCSPRSDFGDAGHSY